MPANFSRPLVTGGAGFVGSHLVDRLCSRGAAVTVLDNLTTGSADNLAASPGAELVIGDVCDVDLVRRLVAGSDIVYHLAAAVGVHHIVTSPLEAIRTNVWGTEAVLSAALEARVPVLLASSSEVYGRSADTPFREDGVRALGPTWIHRWSYSTAKALDEHIAFAMADRGLAVSIVRYFNSYGPRMDEAGYGSVVARFIVQALAGAPITVHGDGRQSRAFTHVSDTVLGTILAAETADARGRVFNIGAERETTIAELALLIKEFVRSPSEIVYMPHSTYYGASYEDTLRRVPSAELARRLLKFSARVSLQEGLRETIAWCRSNFKVRRS